MATHADPNPKPASCPDTPEDDMHPQNGRHTFITHALAGGRNLA